MTVLHWKPGQIEVLTMPQLLCLLSARPPGREASSAVAAIQAAVTERERIEREWAGADCSQPDGAGKLQ